MSDLVNSPRPDGEEQPLRVLTNRGPLGSIRLTVRAIAEAEGYVIARHGSMQPVVVPEREWRALPLAQEDNFDL